MMIQTITKKGGSLLNSVLVGLNRLANRALFIEEPKG
jgi:hypothetical protein